MRRCTTTASSSREKVSTCRRARHATGATSPHTSPHTVVHLLICGESPVAFAATIIDQEYERARR
eukprot:3181290-Prymnesium_polylepis.1